MKYSLITIAILCLVCYIVYTDDKRIKELQDFYYTECVAAPGQISLMKWVNGKPQCTRVEDIKPKNQENLQSWKKFM